MVWTMIMAQEQPFNGTERRRKHRTWLGLLADLLFLASWWPSIFTLPLPTRRTVAGNGRRRRQRGGRRATDQQVLGLELLPAAGPQPGGAHGADAALTGGMTGAAPRRPYRPARKRGQQRYLPRIRGTGRRHGKQ